MSKPVDIKSLLIGGLLVLLVLSCFGALPWLPQDRFGRFAVGTTDEGAFIVDTATGQTWSYVMSSTWGLSSTPSVDEFFAPKLDVSAYEPMR